MAAEPKLEPTVPPGLHLISAFLAMEPSDSLLFFSRVCGGGLVTEKAQRFIWDHCVSNKAGDKGYAHYLKNFVKKLIFEIESRNETVLDELYEQCGYYMTSLKENGFVKERLSVCKSISFLFPDGCELSSCPKSSNLMVPLYCSPNMLEGDTGCSVWPSSLYLSETILSFPDIFSNKSCFEVGSGVGLVGICLSHVKASEVILSDGDLSTLANMKLNLELNQLSTETDAPERSFNDVNMEMIIQPATAEMDNKPKVKCVHLPWESALESELQEFMPDILLGADVIYDPSCVPHLVRVLAMLLNQMKTPPKAREQSCLKVSCTDDRKAFCVYDQDGIKDDSCQVEVHCNCSSVAELKKGPTAYIASVIRNMDTFNYFLELAQKANLIVKDVTQTLKPLNLLPYMQSYDRSTVHLFTITCK